MNFYVVLFLIYPSSLLGLADTVMRRDLQNAVQYLLKRRAQDVTEKIASYEDEGEKRLTSTTSTTIPPPLLDHVVEAFRKKYYLMKSIQNNLEQEQAKIERKKRKQFARQQRRNREKNRNKRKQKKHRIHTTTTEAVKDDQLMAEMEKMMRELRPTESDSDEKPVMRQQLPDSDELAAGDGLAYDFDEVNLRIPL